MTGPREPIPFLDRLGEQLEQAGPGRRRPSARVLSAAAVVVVLLLGVGAVLTFRSDPVSAGVAVTHGPGTVRVHLFGKAPTAEELEDVLHRNGLDQVTVDEEPASPRNVGQLLPSGLSPEAAELEVADGDRPLGTLGDVPTGTSFDTIVFPKNWPGELLLVLGRPAHGDEEYFLTDDALRRGGLLACRYQATPRELLAAARARGVQVAWTQYGRLFGRQITEAHALALHGWRVFAAIETGRHRATVRLTPGGDPLPGPTGTTTTVPDPSC